MLYYLFNAVLHLPTILLALTLMWFSFLWLIATDRETKKAQGVTAFGALCGVWWLASQSPILLAEAICIVLPLAALAAYGKGRVPRLVFPLLGGMLVGIGVMDAKSLYAEHFDPVCLWESKYGRDDLMCVGEEPTSFQSVPVECRELDSDSLHPSGTILCSASEGDRTWVWVHSLAWGREGSRLDAIVIKSDGIKERIPEKRLGVEWREYQVGGSKVGYSHPYYDARILQGDGFYALYTDSVLMDRALREVGIDPP